ncbi:hypothetical protein THL1_2078 [Pseudomonas sp. TCU-HL1]|nr:hypothetical protein THL1_2078 [Pseudomonas sp. TCU-HL1]
MGFGMKKGASSGALFCAWLFRKVAPRRFCGANSFAKGLQRSPLQPTGQAFDLLRD